jgi:dTDP-4-amino-4,6-dideoxygalactose transaminase
MIPIVDLKAQYHSIKADIDAAVGRVLESAQFILGEEVAAFEREFAQSCGASEAIGLNSGTSALHLALLAAGVGAGDEVITVPFTFVASVAAIQYAGARPVLVDIEPKTFTIDPSRIEQAITPTTKAIIPVHLYGQTADMAPIVEIARARGIAVVEDAAQAHLAEYRGRRAGVLGDLATFSFYPGKNLGAYGEGGAVVTNNPEYASQVRLMRSWGEKRRYEHSIKGFNYRMEGMQGAILRVKLRHLEAWTEARRRHAASYDRLLAGSGLALPYARPDSRHVYHCYTIRTPRRDEVRAQLDARGIQTGVHYPVPVHLQPAYADLGYRRGDFPVAETVATDVLSLPVYPELREDQIAAVAEALVAATAPHGIDVPS